MNILFINGCIRGKDLSRSYKIAKEFMAEIKKLSPEANIEEIDLMEINPEYMTYSNFSKREELISAGDFSSKTFDLAKQFAKADRIAIVVPFWEYSFPAILKAYIENISVAGLAFRYSEAGSVGLCKAKKMVYITTRGGFASGESQWMENGASHLKNLCTLYGIEDFLAVEAEGLDILGADVEGLLEEAVEKAKEVAKTYIS